MTCPSVGHSVLDSSFPASGGGGAHLSLPTPSAPPSLSQPYLAPGSLSSISLSPVSGFQNLHFSGILYP